MNQTDVKVSFYLKKSEADAKGNCPVMARLIVGKYSETAFSVKLRVPQSFLHLKIRFSFAYGMSFFSINDCKSYFKA